METRAIIAKLVTILDKYKKLKKNRGRKTDQQKTSETILNSELSQLFDVSHKNAMSLITINEDKDFLIDQRTVKKMEIAGKDKKLAKKEEKMQARENLMKE